MVTIKVTLEYVATGKDQDEALRNIVKYQSDACYKIVEDWKKERSIPPEVRLVDAKVKKLTIQEIK